MGSADVSHISPRELSLAFCRWLEVELSHQVRPGPGTLHARDADGYGPGSRNAGILCVLGSLLPITPSSLATNAALMTPQRPASAALSLPGKEHSRQLPSCFLRHHLCFIRSGSITEEACRHVYLGACGGGLTPCTLLSHAHALYRLSRAWRAGIQSTAARVATGTVPSSLAAVPEGRSPDGFTLKIQCSHVRVDHPASLQSIAIQ